MDYSILADPDAGKKTKNDELFASLWEYMEDDSIDIPLVLQINYMRGTGNGPQLSPLDFESFLKDGKTRPARAVLMEEPAGLWPRHPPIRYRAKIPTNWLELTISEGRNRQVRRMTAAVNFPTLRLIRVRVGDWSLGDLKPGEWMEV